MIVSEYIKKSDAEYIVKTAIKAFPSADVVEVKHGKWTIRSTSYRDKLNFECSVCHNRYLRGTGENMNYCPNCGAKMDGKEQEHE